MKIGIIGLGTVGIGVIDIIAQERTRLEAEINEEITVAYACARSERLLSTPETLYTPNWKDMIKDPQVDTIVELIGGITLAYEVVMAALDHGKNVVTANKALIAHYATDLFAKAKDK